MVIGSLQMNQAMRVHPTIPAQDWETVPSAAMATDGTWRLAWNRLNDGALALPFMTADTIAAAIECFGDGREQMLIARSNGKVCAMFVAVPQGRLGWATFQPSQLPLGAFVTDLSVPLPDLARGALRHALKGLPAVFSVTQVDPLLSPSGEDASDNRHDHYIDTSWIDVNGSFEDYWAQRGKNLRQNLRKQRNKMAAESIQPSMRWHRDRASMADALVRYGKLETQGWKAAEGTAIADGNAQGRFYRRVLEQAADEGHAWVSEYCFGDRTVAMNFGVERNGVLVVLKTAYDESVPKTLSPASLLREEELRRIFDEKSFRRIEFYGRTMEWHTKLTDQRRAIHHLTTYRGAWLKSLAAWRRTRNAPAAPVEAAKPTED